MPASPIPYPLDPVTVSGTLITMDQYLNAPTVMVRRIADIAAQEFFAHKIFSNGGAVTGGAILFERPNPLLTDLFAERRLQEMAPGTTAPVLTFVRGVPMVAVPREIGGKFPLTKQELKRNNPRLVETAMTQIGNTIARDLEVMALSELNAVISSTSRTFASTQTLATSAAATISTMTAANQPSADVGRLVATIRNEGRGHNLNSAIYNSLDWATMTAIYSVGGVASGVKGVDGDAGARAMLRTHGISTVDVSVQQTLGKAKFYESGQVGTWSNEFPLEHITWIDEEEDQKRWDQFTVSPCYVVDDQFAMIEQTGL
jgi:hypothetical protein